MEIARIQVVGNMLRVRQCAGVTRGLVGAVVIFESFSPEWQGLSKTAVFRTQEVSRDVVNVLEGERTEIPWEVLEDVGRGLMVGLCGTSKDGTVVLTTEWGQLGQIVPGAIPVGRPSEPPTPDWTQRIEGQVNEALEQMQIVSPALEKTIACMNAAGSFASQAETAKNEAGSAAEQAQNAVNSIGSAVSDAENAAQTAERKAAAAETARAYADAAATNAENAARAAVSDSDAAAVYADTAVQAAAQAKEEADRAANLREVPVVQTSEVNLVAEPNVLYVFPHMAEIHLTLAPEKPGIVNQYMIAFESGAEPTTLSVPAEVRWPIPPVVEANKAYQVSIVRNLGVIAGA